MPASHTSATFVSPFVPLIRIGASPDINYKFALRLDDKKLFDINHGGRGRVAGTVKVKGSPNYAVKRYVLLMREKDFMIIRATWSDPTTGAYEFTYVDHTQRYTVLTMDYEHNYRAVVADNLVPELMT